MPHRIREIQKIPIVASANIWPRAQQAICLPDSPCLSGTARQCLDRNRAGPAACSSTLFPEPPPPAPTQAACDIPTGAARQAGAAAVHTQRPPAFSITANALLKSGSKKFSIGPRTTAGIASNKPVTWSMSR